MNRQVNAIAGRLSLRPPQRRSLEILDRITEIAALDKDADVIAALAAIRSEFPTVTDFEREFPSLCFALATGVGKTRLMGAFVAYLHLAHGLNNFFILAPNLTIYRKLIEDFRPNSPKYVFSGIAEFALDPPAIITGDNYEQGIGVRKDRLPGLDEGISVNIFNISKINSEVRGGKSPKIKRLSEYLGESYFEYLAGLPDLVLLMDESHRYRASAGVRAINELKPVLGLELTATPFVETAKGGVPFRNVIYDYPLGKAMADGFVKEPAVVTRRNFDPSGMTPDDIERIKLEDGIRLHESVKVELDTYHRETGAELVKPFVLVIARDTTHAARLLEQIESPFFFEGRYNGKAIQVDSSKTGVDEDVMVERLLAVESTTEATEIVIHVNMLKEGWDVTNLYTIIPLRAANARILIEQSIGRGLRLPYGKRTGVDSVDTLNIVAHDKFQEIVEEARRSDSPIRMKQIILDERPPEERPVLVPSTPNVESVLGLSVPVVTEGTQPTPKLESPVFVRPEEQRVAQLTYEVIRQFEAKPERFPNLASLDTPGKQAELVREVETRMRPEQLSMDALTPAPDVASVVARTVALVTERTIPIPRIIVLPLGDVRGKYQPFTLDLSAFRYPAPDNALWIQHLRTGKSMSIGLSGGGIEEERLEDYVVSGLVDFDDVAYDEHAELLYDLAEQTVEHFQAYLSDADIHKVLSLYQRNIVKSIHTQMREHYREEEVEYEVKISKGYTTLRPSAYSAYSTDQILNYKSSPQDKSNMAKYLFGGFARCLYPVQKFDSDSERRLAVILERDALKWFKPARGQFQLYYRSGADHHEYQPDFVAEASDGIYMIEPKASNQMTDKDVLAKRDVAVTWCRQASEYAKKHGGKGWTYVLIPHDAIADNKTLRGLADQFAER